MNISWFFDCSDTVGQAVKMMKYAVTSFEPTQLFLIPAGREGVAFTPYALMILLGGCIVLFIVSVLQERGIKIREKISERSFAVQFILYAGLLLSNWIFWLYSSSEGIYICTILKRIRRMIIAIALIIVILLGLDYILYPCTFMRNDIHTVTTQKHQDIFMGTSHGKMNIDPKTISSVTGRTGHNLCVGGEYGIDAYYLAKLLLEKQKPERIIYEVDPGYFATQKEEGNNYLLFYHQFPISVSKAEYFGDLLLDCDFRSVLFPLV